MSFDFFFDHSDLHFQISLVFAEFGEELITGLSHISYLHSLACVIGTAVIRETLPSLLRANKHIIFPSKPLPLLRTCHSPDILSILIPYPYSFLRVKTFEQLSAELKARLICLSYLRPNRSFGPSMIRCFR